MSSRQRFQSTPPCGGDGLFTKGSQKETISIHAPLRGRHPKRSRLDPGGRISIHAPLRGRPWGQLPREPPPLFQSTPPCGGDSTSLRLKRMQPDFNPRPLAGATMPGTSATSITRFQSTPPCGGDSMGSPSVPADADFNPRSLAGATADADVVDCLRGISIHAPLRGRPIH